MKLCKNHIFVIYLSSKDIPGIEPTSVIQIETCRFQTLRTPYRFKMFKNYQKIV